MLGIVLLFSVFIVLFIFFHHRVRQSTAIKRWYRQLDLSNHQKTFEHLFHNVNGFFLSSQARKKNDAMEYTYGEMEFIPFIALLSLVKIDQHTVFYDLGSGTGKAVLACAMVFHVKKSKGIELFKELHQAAQIQKEHLHQQPGYQKKAETIQFINDNFLKADFSDATLIMINASALFGETWDRLKERLLQQKPGTTIITTSKKLPTEFFVLKKETLVQMSWGFVTAYIQERRRTAPE